MSDAQAKKSEAVNEAYGEAAKMFQSALEVGVRIQEQSTKAFNEMFQGLGSPQNWQQQTQDAMEKTVEMAKTNYDEAIQLMNENTRTGMQLLEKAFSVRESDLADMGQARTRELWETAIGSLRRNTEVLVQANGRLLDSWRQVTTILQGQPSDQGNGKAEES